MANSSGCPACGSQLFLPESPTGNSIQCPFCGHSFTPLSAGEPSPEPAIAEKHPRVGILVTPGKKREPITPLPVAPARPSASIHVEPVNDIVIAPSPAPPPPAPAPEPPPVTSASGRRLTTLVRDAVEAAVSRSPATAPKGINELSLIALTLALIALGITWPLRVANLGVLLGGSALLLGCIALFLLVRRRASGAALPVLATLLSAQALGMALLLLGTPEPPRETPVNPIVEKATLPDLHKVLASGDAAEKAEAVRAIGTMAGNLESTCADLLTGLQDSDATVRAASADTLGRLGPPVRVAYGILLRAARIDPSPAVRDESQLALKRIAPPNRADLSDFLVKLKDPHAPRLRAAAALALGQIGPEARDALPALEKSLADDDAAVRVCVAQALWEIGGEQVKEVVPVLVAGLQDRSNAAVRARAAAALGAMRSQNAKALEALEDALADTDNEVRIEAAFALGTIGAQKSALKFLTALRDPEIKVRLVAAQAVWLLGRHTQGVPVLIEALSGEDPDLRLNAVVALAKMGPDAREAVGALAKALHGRDAAVRAHAAEALYRVGPEAKSAVPSLCDALQSPDASLRVQAAYALGGVGKEAREALPMLERALTDKETAVRLFAARALWAVEPKIGVVLPVLTQALQKDADAGQRARAAAILGSLGLRAQNAVPDLLDAVHDADKAVRIAAARALGDIGGPRARVTYPALSELTREDQSDETLRATAAEALKKIGRATRVDIDTLISALDNPKARYRASAAVSLWLLNREAKKAVQALSQRLRDENETVCTTAAFALAAIGPDAGAAVPELIAALEHKTEALHARAAYTLGEIGQAAAEAVPALNRLLAREDTETIATRFQAARALWAIAQQTKDILPVLAEALKDEDPDLNRQAAETLAKMAAKLPAADAALKQQLRERTVPHLIRLLSQEKADPVRTTAATTLGSLGLEAQAAVPALMQALEEEDAELRGSAAEALGKIGAAETEAKAKPVAARTAYSALLFFSKVDPHERVQRAANTALLKIGRPSGEDAPGLIDILRDRKQPLFYRNASAQVLGIIGPELGKANVPRVGAILREDEEPAIRALVVYVLGEVGAEARSESALLLRSLKDPDPGVRAGAAYALGEIFQGRVAPEVAAALRDLIESPDESVAIAARTALKKVKAK
jgi:HEAT repeat protein